MDGPDGFVRTELIFPRLPAHAQVGYGDVVPMNNVERVYSLFALLIGALVFGYMLSTIGTLVASLDRQAALSEDRMDAIKEYMRFRKLPRELVVRVRRYYEYHLERKTAFDENAILAGLNPPLRLEVVRHALRETIGRIPLFSRSLDPVFLMEIFPYFRPIAAAPHEVVYAKGEPSFGVFFLLRGKIEAIAQMDEHFLYHVRQGGSFGESVLTGRRRSSTMRAVVACDMYTIPKDDLRTLFREHPREGQIIRQQLLREHIRKEKMRQFALASLLERLSKETDTESREAAAALHMQLSWGRICERLALKTTPLVNIQKDALGQALVYAAVVPPGCEVFPQAPLGEKHVLTYSESNAMTAQHDGPADSIPARLSADPSESPRLQQTLVAASGEDSGSSASISSHALHVANRPGADASSGAAVLRALQRDMHTLTAMVQDMQEKLAALSLGSSALQPSPARRVDDTQDHLPGQE